MGTLTIFGNGFAYSATNAVILLEHARKRTSVWSLGYSSVGDFVLTASGVGIAVTEIDLDYRADGKTRIRLTTLGGLPTGRITLYANSTTDAYIDIINQL